MTAGLEEILLLQESTLKQQTVNHVRLDYADDISG